ncbi:MAG: hypothetical protein ABH873_02785 [Candidatus Firestonebacteria bacterium]
MNIQERIEKYLVNEEIDFEKFKNKEVIITTKKNSKYKGTLSIKGGDKENFLLKDMVVLNKDGSYKGVSGTAELNKRLFKRNGIIKIEKYTEK